MALWDNFLQKIEFPSVAKSFGKRGLYIALGELGASIQSTYKKQEEQFLTKSAPLLEKLLDPYIIQVSYIKQNTNINQSSMFAYLFFYPSFSKRFSKTMFKNMNYAPGQPFFEF